MDDPRTELKADTDKRRNPPEFDDLVPPEGLVAGDRTRDDFFDTMLGLGSPATVGKIVDLARHGVDATREYLEWFERMDIVTRITDSPTTYERDQEYPNQWRVQQLRNRYDDEKLLAFLEDAMERDESFAERFGVESSDAVAIAAHATDADRSAEIVWREMSAWKTTRRQISLPERALQTDTNGAAGQRAVA